MVFPGLEKNFFLRKLWGRSRSANAEKLERASFDDVMETSFGLKFLFDLLKVILRRFRAKSLLDSAN